MNVHTFKNSRAVFFIGLTIDQNSFRDLSGEHDQHFRF